MNGSDSEDSPFAFPWILETLNIQAYDFSKVLESFIRAEPRFPADVVKVHASKGLSVPSDSIIQSDQVL